MAPSPGGLTFQLFPQRSLARARARARSPQECIFIIIVLTNNFIKSHAFGANPLTRIIGYAGLLWIPMRNSPLLSAAGYRPWPESRAPHLRRIILRFKKKKKDEHRGCQTARIDRRASPVKRVGGVKGRREGGDGRARRYCPTGAACMCPSLVPSGQDKGRPLLCKAAFDCARPRDKTHCFHKRNALLVIKDN